MRAAHGKLDPKRRSLSGAITVREDPTALELDQVTADRQAQPQATVQPTSARVRLAEALEQMRKKLRGNPDPVVADGQLDVTVDTLQPKLHPAARVRELDGI